MITHVQIPVRHRIVVETKSITMCDDCPHRSRLVNVCRKANDRAIGPEKQHMLFYIPDWCPLPSDPKKEDEVITIDFGLDKQPR